MEKGRINHRHHAVKGFLPLGNVVDHPDVKKQVKTEKHSSYAMKDPGYITWMEPVTHLWLKNNLFHQCPPSIGSTIKGSYDPTP
jgi:hypothetical protein